MKIKLLLPFVVFLLFLSVFAQENVSDGNVTEENQTPEPVLEFEITGFGVEGEASVASTLNLKLTITNTGDLNIVGANAILTLPDGTVASTTSLFIGDLSAGDEITIDWPIFVISEGDFTFDVVITTGNGLTETISTTIATSITEKTIKLPPGLVRKDPVFRPPGLVLVEKRNEIFAGSIFYPLKKIITKRAAKQFAESPSVEKKKAPDTKKSEPSDDKGKPTEVEASDSDTKGKPTDAGSKDDSSKSPGSKSKSKKKITGSFILNIPDHVWFLE